MRYCNGYAYILQALMFSSRFYEWVRCYQSFLIILICLSFTYECLHCRVLWYSRMPWQWMWQEHLDNVSVYECLTIWFKVTYHHNQYSKLDQSFDNFLNGLKYFTFQKTNWGCGSDMESMNNSNISLVFWIANSLLITWAQTFSAFSKQ